MNFFLEGGKHQLYMSIVLVVYLVQWYSVKLDMEGSMFETAFCNWTRHFILCLVLVQLKKTGNPPDMTWLVHNQQQKQKNKYLVRLHVRDVSVLICTFYFNTICLRNVNALANMYACIDFVLVWGFTGRICDKNDIICQPRCPYKIVLSFEFYFSNALNK